MPSVGAASGGGATSSAGASRAGGAASRRGRSGAVDSAAGPRGVLGGAASGASTVTSSSVSGGSGRKTMKTARTTAPAAAAAIRAARLFISRLRSGCPHQREGTGAILSQRLVVHGQIRRRKAAERDLADRRALQVGTDRRYGERSRLFDWIAVDARADGGKRNRLQLMRGGQLQRAPVARRQQIGLTVGSAAPHRPDGMNDVLCGKSITSRDLRVAGGAPAEAAAFLQQLRACPAVDRAVNPTAA